MNHDGHQPHILVVDDSPEILDLKDDILESEGFRVSTLLRTGTGLEDIITAEPHLLVMDYVPEEASPLMFEAATDPRTAHVPILLCAGAIREVESIRPQLDAIGIGVIFKPFDIDELVAVVREAMGLSAVSN